MRVIVIIKTGSEGAGFFKSQECDLDDKEAERLKADWEKHVMGKDDRNGGVYRYHRGDEERALYIRFSDVLLME